jgi:hypothetical protein
LWNISLPRNVLEFGPKYAIKKSNCVIDRLRDVQADRSCKLVSLEVKYLFPSVPLSDLKHISDSSLKIKLLYS